MSRRAAPKANSPAVRSTEGSPGSPPGRPNGEYRSAQHEGTLTSARSAGFTLIEVLVALGIVAVALVAGLQASMALGNNAQRQADVLLAQICAENELVRLRLSRQLPPIGGSDFVCEQAGRVLGGRLQVTATPNPIFRRVDAQVLDGDVVVFRLATIAGSFQ